MPEQGFALRGPLNAIVLPVTLLLSLGTLQKSKHPMPDSYTSGFLICPNPRSILLTGSGVTV
ncbi:hypothetical protein H6F87_29100 [Cyanobacteria bacterium FACHB-502]|nr:hypothetical protein [Cyanobacteria bacterium FACHB-502]